MKQALLTKGILVLALAMIATTTIAQKKKEKPKEKKTQEIKATTEEVDMPVVEEIAIAVEEPVSYQKSTGPVKMVSNIRFNNQYETYGAITNDYDWFFDRYASGDRKYGIVNKAGDVILPNLFYKDYGQSSSVLLKLEDRYGIYDVGTLRWTVPMEYESLSRLNNNLFIAKRGGKYGLIDNNNIQVMAFEWNNIESINGLDHYVIVRGSGTSEKQYGIYSIIEKRLTVPCKYTSLVRLSKKFAFKVQDGTKFNVVDIQNVPQFKQWYDDMQTIYSDADHYIVKLKDRYGIIDDNEQAIVPIEYLEIDKSQYSDGSHLARNKMGKYGFIRPDGQVTLPFVYDNLKREYGSYSGSMISVQNEKCGLVQISSGVIREIVTCDFDNIKGLNNVYVVEKNKQYGLLNESGKPITEIEYQSIEVLTPNSGSLLIRAMKDNSYRLLNLLGKPISNSKFEELSIVPNSVNYYYDAPKFTYMKAREKGGKYSLIDQVGLAVTKPIFDDVIWEGQNLATVKSNGKFGIYYILNQTQVVDFKYDQIVNAKNYFIGFAGNSIDMFRIESGNLVMLDSKK